MRPIKKFLQNDRLRRFACRLGAAYIRLVWLTGRWRTVGGETPEEFWREGRPFIFCFWHGRLLMMVKAWNPAAPFHMLASPHRDGQLIADTVGHFGIGTMAGSSTHGGTGALRAMVKALKNGESIGITPDAPRGPRMRCGMGVIALAKLSGAAIIPAATGSSRRHVFRSWDRFIAAFPFSRGVFVWGQPIEVARDADETALEAARLRVEESLNALTREADRLSGHETFIEPGEAAGKETV